MCACACVCVQKLNDTFIWIYAKKNMIVQQDIKNFFQRIKEYLTNFFCLFSWLQESNDFLIVVNILKSLAA